MKPNRHARWRRRLRAYGAAVMLNAAVVTGLPAARPVEPVPIVRPFARRGSGFDTREIVGADIVLTVPMMAEPRLLGWDAEAGGWN